MQMLGPAPEQLNLWDWGGGAARTEGGREVQHLLRMHLTQVGGKEVEDWGGGLKPQT